MIRACIFDLGGTVVDRYSLTPFLALRKTFRDKDIYISNDLIFKDMGKNKKDHIRNILYSPNISQKWIHQYQTLQEEDVSSLMNDFNNVQMEYSEKIIDILPETKDCVHTLQSRDIQIGCTTGFNAENMNIIRKKLNKNDIHFNSYVSSTCIDKPSRPHPYMIQKNMELLNIRDPKTVIKLDDTVVGIHEGIAANCLTVGVAKWSIYMNISTIDDAYYFHHDLHKEEMDEKLIQSRKILNEAGADFVIDSLDELPSLIDKINYNK